jgi:DHA1 family bicyclomycin/chloramphenicol resistance-like MFS transporter
LVGEWRSSGRSLFWVLGALSIFGPLSTDMFLPGLPMLTRDLHTSASTANLTLTGSVLGIAIGQLVAGAISDSRGRLLPIRVGLIGYTLASVICAISPSIWPLIAVRFIQGVCGGSSIVVARAIVRDLFEGVRAAQMFATLVMLTGVAPVIAPLIGGGVLAVSTWRGVFVVQAAIGLAVLMMAVRMVPETLPVPERHTGGFRSALVAFRRLLGDRRFAPYMWSYALSFCVMFAWISGGSYVMENVYGVSPQLFSLIFAVNALAFSAASQTCARFVAQVPPARLARWGLVVVAMAAVAALLVTAGRTGIWPLLVVLFIVLAANGVVLPNAISAAMASQGEMLGSASALIGLAQFGFGAAVAPFVGLGGSHDALPMGVAMAATGCAALVINLLFGRSGTSSAPSSAAPA